MSVRERRLDDDDDVLLLIARLVLVYTDQSKPKTFNQ